jgi:DNA-directed RNA polymerase subunit H (RpoH/RPB5)
MTEKEKEEFFKKGYYILSIKELNNIFLKYEIEIENLKRIKNLKQ